MSEQTVTGFVAKVFVKSGTNSKGRPWTAWSAKIQDPKSGDEFPKFYQFGFDDPGIAEGDYIQFKATDKDDKAAQVTKGSVRKSKNPPSRPEPTRKADGGRKGAGGYQGMSPERQAAITHQHSQEMAIQTIGLLLEHNALPVKGGSTKADKVKRFEEILAYIDKLTVKYHKDVDTMRLLESVADMGDVDLSPKGDLPEDADEEPTQEDPQDEFDADLPPDDFDADDEDPDFE